MSMPMGTRSLPFSTTAGASASSVTVMKVDPAGNQRFGNYGREVSDSLDFLGNPKVAATTEGSVVAGWIEGNNLKFQKLNGVGAKLWGETGITISAPPGVTYSLADLHGSDDGSVIASWVSAAGFTGPKHLLANKLGPDGALQWGAMHVAVFDGGSLQFGNFPPFVTDGAGGAVFGWYETGPLQSRAQHILANGTEAFPHNGSLGSTNTGFDHVNPSVSYDQATGDTYLFWDEILEGPLTNEGISGQKFNPAGDRQWGDSGLVVQPFTSSAVLNVTSVFTSTGPLVVWSSEAAFAQAMITGAKLDPSGAFLCSPFAVSSILSSKSRLDLTLSSTTLPWRLGATGALTVAISTRRTLSLVVPWVSKRPTPARRAHTSPAGAALCLRPALSDPQPALT